MSKIREALLKAADTEMKKGESHADLCARLVDVIGDLPDKDWNKIPNEAQVFFNVIATAHNEKKDFPDWPDAEKSEDSGTGRVRTRAASSEPAAAESYTPKRKDEVKITNKRGKVYEGTIVEIDKDEIVIKTASGDEEAIDRDRIESIEPLGAGGSKSSKASSEPAEPQVGDTVEIVTARDKIVTGKLVEETGDDIVLELDDGSKEDYSKGRLKSVKVVSAGKGAGKAESTSRTSTEKDEPAKEEKKTRAKAEGGVSATTRVRELIADDVDATKEAIKKLVAKEGLEVKDNTLDLIYGDCHKFIKMLRERKLLK